MFSRPKPLTVVTYNIHKGLSQFNKRVVLHEIRDRLRFRFSIYRNGFGKPAARR